MDTFCLSSLTANNCAVLCYCKVFPKWTKQFCHCADGNVNQLLPLVEEYQITAVKKKCEEFLLTKTGSMELLITGVLCLFTIARFYRAVHM